MDMLKGLLRWIFLFCAIAVATMSSAYALTYQSFIGTAFDNPANLSLIKQNQILLGATDIDKNAHFVGTLATTSGTVTSKTNTFLPYGRFATRLSEQFVVGVNISQPLFTNLQYPRGSFINSLAVDTEIRDYDISPRMSYQVTKDLALGLGINFNHLFKTRLNFNIAPFGLLANHADSWAKGWDAGLFYAIKYGTYLSASYYSKIVQSASGRSTWGSTVTRTKTSVIIPATLTGDLIQYFSKQWLIDAQLRFIQWSPVQYTVLDSTAAGNITLTQKFHNTFEYGLSTKYDFNDQWSGLGTLVYSPASQITAYRSLSLPSFRAWIAGLGGEYNTGKGLKAKLVYLHVFDHPPINTATSSGLLVGRLNVVSNVLDLSLIYDF